MYKREKRKRKASQKHKPCVSPSEHLKDSNLLIKKIEQGYNLRTGIRGVVS